jgi:hypothetical protein
VLDEWSELFVWIPLCSDRSRIFIIMYSQKITSCLIGPYEIMVLFTFASAALFTSNEAPAVDHALYAA